MVTEREFPGRGVWPRIVGPLATLLVCASLWLLAYADVVRLVPAPFLGLAVVFGALRGRIVGGLTSVVIAVAYAAIAHQLIGTPLGPPTVTDLIVLAILLASVVFLVSSRVDWLHARVETALAAAATAERRAALVTGDAARRASETGEVGRLYEDLRQRAGRDAHSLEVLEAALDAVAQGVAVVDRQANLIWWNRSLAALGGLPSEARRSERARGDLPAAFIDRDQLARAFDRGETVTRLSKGTLGLNGDKPHTYVEQYAPLETAGGGRLVAVTVAQVMPHANGNSSPPAAASAPASLPSSNDPVVLDPEVIDTLRAPLAAIREYVWYMVAGPDQPRRRANDEYGSRVLGAAQQMDERIQALAEYSQVLRGPVKTEPIQLGEVVRDALQGLEPGLTASGARVRIVAHPAPGPVSGDRQLLTLAVTHLIGNAIKYVPADVPPRVLLWMEQVDGRARLSVEDNGIGIAKGDERRLFRLFERLPEAEAYPGNGVGLAVVRAAVERMGGRIGLQSEPGWGSRFWIELRGADAGDPAQLSALDEQTVGAEPVNRPEGSSFAGIADDEWRPI